MARQCFYCNIYAYIPCFVRVVNLVCLRHWYARYQALWIQSWVQSFGRAFILDEVHDVAAASTTGGFLAWRIHVAIMLTLCRMYVAMDGFRLPL